MSDKSDKHYKKNYVALWLLLAVALLVVVVVAFLDFDLHVGEAYVIKKAPFKEVILKADEVSSPQDSVCPQDSVSLQHSQRVVYEPDTTVRSILIFGDSMTILVANRMAAYGKQNGYKIYSVTWDSSTSVGWSGCDTLDNFIARYRPDFIMVTLGSNELFLKNFDSRKPYVQKIVEKIGNIPFVWIGPPNWKEDQGYNAMMQSVLPAGTFFCSDGLDLPRGADRIHPTPKGGIIWTDSIMRWMPSTPHPIRSEVPDSSIGTPSHKYHYFKAS